MYRGVLEAEGGDVFADVDRGVLRRFLRAYRTQRGVGGGEGARSPKLGLGGGRRSPPAAKASLFDDEGSSTATEEAYDNIYVQPPQ